MEYPSRLANFEDIPKLLALQALVQTSLSEQSLFAEGDEQFFQDIVEGQGQILLALDLEQIIGCAILLFPKEDNLGLDLAFSPSELAKVAHLEMFFVHPDYQRQGIAKNLSKLNIEQAVARGKKHILATAHPCNYQSIKNLISLKFVMKKFLYKYGDLPRFILEYSPEYFVESVEVLKQINAKDFSALKAELEQNMLGVQIENKNSELLIGFTGKK